MSTILHPNSLVSEEAARQFFLNIIAANGKHACPRCHSKKHYHLASGQQRCVRCKYTFHAFTHRWINRGRLSFAKWLKVVAAFALEWPAQKVSEAFNISYNTAYHCFQTIRYAITASTNDGMDLLQHGMNIERPYFGAMTSPTASNKVTVQVFGIQFIKEQVHVRGISSLTIPAIHKLGLALGKIGPFVFTERLDPFNHLIFYDDLSQKKLSGGNRISYTSIEFTWPWAENRLVSHRGLSAKKLPLYLKELEFRFNHQPGELFELIARYLCQWDISKLPVPN